jgi:hypothetical protein
VLYHREISIIPSYSPALQDLQDAVRLVFSEAIRLTPLVTHRADLDAAPSVFEQVRLRQGLKAVVYPHGIPPLLSTDPAVTVLSSLATEDDPLPTDQPACALP